MCSVRMFPPVREPRSSTMTSISGSFRRSAQAIKARNPGPSNYDTLHTFMKHKDHAACEITVTSSFRPFFAICHRRGAEGAGADGNPAVIRRAFKPCSAGLPPSREALRRTAVALAEAG